MKRAALYVRVSTDEQTVQNQIADLEAVAARNGWQIVKTFADEGISGAKGRDGRPAFDALCSEMGEFDVIMAWSIDRLGRSLPNLIDFMAMIRETGVDMYLHQQNIDTTTAAGRMMFGMFSVIAEYEREMIRERVMSGIARAKKQGVRFGAPAKIDAAKVAQVLAMQGKSCRDVARLTGISKSRVSTIRKQAS